MQAFKYNCEQWETKRLTTIPNKFNYIPANITLNIFSKNSHAKTRIIKIKMGGVHVCAFETYASSRVHRLKLCFRKVTCSCWTRVMTTAVNSPFLLLPPQWTAETAPRCHSRASNRQAARKHTHIHF